MVYNEIQRQNPNYFSTYEQLKQYNFFKDFVANPNAPPLEDFSQNGEEDDNNSAEDDKEDEDDDNSSDSDADETPSRSSKSTPRQKFSSMPIRQYQQQQQQGSFGGSSRGGQNPPWNVATFLGNLLNEMPNVKVPSIMTTGPALQQQLQAGAPGGHQSSIEKLLTVSWERIKFEKCLGRYKRNVDLFNEIFHKEIPEEEHDSLLVSQQEHILKNSQELIEYYTVCNNVTGNAFF